MEIIGIFSTLRGKSTKPLQDLNPGPTLSVFIALQTEPPIYKKKYCMETNFFWRQCQRLLTARIRTWAPVVFSGGNYTAHPRLEPLTSCIRCHISTNCTTTGKEYFGEFSNVTNFCRPGLELGPLWYSLGKNYLAHPWLVPITS